MKLDDRGRISDFEVPDAIAKAASPQIFFVHCITLPELPVAVGKTWEVSSTVPIPEVGDRAVKLEHKLAAVTKDRATIETEVKLDAAQAQLPGGATIDKYRTTTVIELATGKLVEMRTECSWSSGPAGQKREMGVTWKLEAIAPPPAKQGSAAAGTGPTTGKG
jgi:hypothetical protein